MIIFSCAFQLGEYLLFASVSPHRLCRNFMNQSAAGLRVNVLTRSKFEQSSSPLLAEVRFSIFLNVLTVLVEEHDLQDLEEVELVRTKNFQFPSDLRHRRPR